MEDLTRLNSLAPPVPGFAEATRIAPERKASSLDVDSGPSSRGAPTPGITIEDLFRPQSPETLIPVTDTLSTRPTRGGVAYPFRLKVEGDDRDVNASTLTLQSVNVETPRVGEFEDEDKKLASKPSTNGVEDGVEKETTSLGITNGNEVVIEKGERPGVDRFFTAGVGELGTGKGDEQKEERPGVERFETALELQSSVANGTKA